MRTCCDTASLLSSQSIISLFNSVLYVEKQGGTSVQPVRQCGLYSMREDEQ